MGMVYAAAMSLPRIAILAVLTLLLACSATTAVSDTFKADGVYVRHVRLRVAPAQTKAFEGLMERCVEAAQSAELSDDHDWLCYRESPGRYWIVTFSGERDGFTVPGSKTPLRTFALSIADREGGAIRGEIAERLGALEYEIEWTLLTRQKKEWSTVDDMSTKTNPKARMMLRTIRPGHEAEFERALTQRTAFFGEHDYPLPVEGFVTLSGAPGTAMQVVFPRDWPSFYARESFWEFVQALPESDREDYMRRKGELMPTMLSAEYYEADHLPDASYGNK